MNTIKHNKMENKFKLTNLVLYAKGWYLKTDDIWADLIKILELDDYSPFNKMDIYSIIINSVQNSNLYRWTELSEVLNGIHPNNCWKYGYYVKDNHGWSNKPTNELPEYDMPTAFIYYTLSNLRLIEHTQWNVKFPKYSKHPKPKHITINKLYTNFCKK